MHPRLLQSLILLDPVISRKSTTVEENPSFISKTTALSTHRRDIWPSRKAAADSYKKSPFYQSWDPRVLERWLHYGLRDLPTAIHPLDEKSLRELSDGHGKPVTLSSTRHQEVFTYARPNYDFPPGTNANKVTHPDLDPNLQGSFPFYRSEAVLIYDQLPHLRPSVMYIFGGKSDICIPSTNEAKMAQTGTGVGGSGGAPLDRVRNVVLDNIGHLVAMEAPVQSAEITSSWLGQELQRWRSEDEAFRAAWSKKSKVEKMTVDDQWIAHVAPPARKPKPAPKL